MRTILALALLSPLLHAQQTWTPDFELRTTTKKLNVGQTFQVGFYVSGVGGDTAGYQSEVHFDPKSVKPVRITQGSYLKFKTFFGKPTAFPTFIRIGALNFPVPTPLPKGAGKGVLATATFQALKAGPINLDMRQSSFSAPGGRYTIKGRNKDVCVQIRASGDILAVSGRPNQNSSVELEVHSPADAGRNVITAGSFKNTGLPLPGGIVVPIGADILLDLALANQWPFSNSLTKLDSNGRAITRFSVPNDSRLVGIKIYFGSVIYTRGPTIFHKASNGTHVAYITP